MKIYNINRNTPLKNKELIKLGFSANVVLVCIVIKILNHQNYKTNIFALYIFGLKICLHLEMHF